MQVVDLFESERLPRWWLSGEPVDMTNPRWADEADFLEPEEFGLEWRLCQVPVSALRSFAKPSLGAFIEHMVQQRGSEEDEAQRLAEIEAWFKAEGGVDPALRRSPLVMTLGRDGRIDLLDGHHRNALAIHRHKRESLTALVGRQ